MSNKSLGCCLSCAAIIFLQNATIQTLQDANNSLEDSWPQELELEGFICTNLGGFGADGETNILNRDCKWFINWSNLDNSYSPPPYEMLARLLRGIGHLSKANAISFVSRKRQRKLAWARIEG